MTLEELNRFIQDSKRHRQNGLYTKEEHIQILKNTDYSAGKWRTPENLALIAEMKTIMDAAIIEAQG